MIKRLLDHEFDAIKNVDQALNEYSSRRQPHQREGCSELETRSGQEANLYCSKGYYLYIAFVLGQYNTYNARVIGNSMLFASCLMSHTLRKDGTGTGMTFAPLLQNESNGLFDGTATLELLY